MDFGSALHILNPNSKNRSGVKKYFKKHNDLQAVWIDRTSHPTHLETVIEWAITEGRTNIVIWGGDGTISRALQALYLSKSIQKVNLCFVPAGTGNDFCRRFGFGSWKKWIKKFESNKAENQMFDVGLLEAGQLKRIFINNSGFGRTREALQRKRPKPISDILNFQTHKLQVEWENGKVHQFETAWAFLGIVFNSPFFNKGMYFDKSILPTDGLLKAFLVPPQNKWGLLSKFLKSRMGFSLHGQDDMILDGHFIHVKSREDLFPQVDGEVVTTRGVKDLRFSVLKNVLKLWVPTFAKASVGTP